MNIEITEDQKGLLRSALSDTYFAGWGEGYLESEAGLRDMEDHVVNRYQTCARHVVPWVRRQRPLEGLELLEIGCGTGSSTAAFAQAGMRVHGYDIEPQSIDAARRRCEILGLKSVEVHLVRPDDLLSAVRAAHEQVDVVLLYAVLEHQTVEERLATLRGCWELLRPGGLMVVYDTPNRLTFFDHHTAELPFFHMLPDRLALQYGTRSQRDAFRRAMQESASEAPAIANERLARWGRGVSYHEFEVALGSLEPLVISDGYAPEILSLLPTRPEEELLRFYFERSGLQVPIGFARACIDVILRKPDGVASPRPERPMPAPLLQVAEPPPPPTSPPELPPSARQDLRTLQEVTLRLARKGLGRMARRVQGVWNGRTVP